MLGSPSLLHLDGEEVVLKLLLRCILVEESVTDLLKAPERWEGVELV